MTKKAQCRVCRRPLDFPILAITRLGHIGHVCRLDDTVNLNDVVAVCTQTCVDYYANRGQLFVDHT